MEVEESTIKVYQITFKEPYCSPGAGQSLIIPIVVPEELKECTVIFPGGDTARVAYIDNNHTQMMPNQYTTLSVGKNQSIAILYGNKEA